MYNHHIYVYTRIFSDIYTLAQYMIISYHPTSAPSSLPLEPGLHHRIGALVLRTQRQGRSRSGRGRSPMPTDPVGSHPAPGRTW